MGESIPRHISEGLEAFDPVHWPNSLIYSTRQCFAHWLVLGSSIVVQAGKNVPGYDWADEILRRASIKPFEGRPYFFRGCPVMLFPDVVCKKRSSEWATLSDIENGRVEID
jgi:hypothetical protein